MATPEQTLTTRQRAFCEAYSGNPNGTQAAITAGYSQASAASTASRLLKHPKVISTLQARRGEALARLEVTEDMVLAELAAVAFSNIEDYVTWDASAGALVVRPSVEIPRHLQAAIESIDEKVLESQNKDGTRLYTRTVRKVKLYSKLDALKTLAEYLGLTDSMAPKVAIFIKTGIERE